ncbi:PTS transporter subunit EIIC [Ligilactobacillus sp. WILCCON 0076]|uniref:Permease IIC component n=1 Tax=Ligilactobacillus ubinensis TaxID=2876789 RepID=A0A9X2FKY3_9LACO|nr:PTS transporter subunit EIIC [Ligilactobacillus ubinensis]MCP0887109.1 PTS transporter subunit EIIC [Ligilactobacillus ubinensis]
MSLTDKISAKLVPVAAKLNGQRHLTAIRDSFIVTMPLIMAASVFILLNALLFSNAAVNKIIDLSKLADLATMTNNATLGILAILVAYNIGINLATWYEANGNINSKAFTPNHAGGLSVCLMFLMMPIQTTVTLTSGKTAAVTGIYSQDLTSSSGLFLAMFAGILGTEIFVRLSKVEKLRIKMPDSVPPAVASTFNSLIPEVLVIIMVAIPIYLIKAFTGMSIPDIITIVIQTPLKGLVLSGVGMIVIQFISDTLWVFGLHGSSILSPITVAPQLESIQENMQAFAAHKTIPNIVNAPFLGSYGMLGGGGCVLALLIAIFLVSKRKEQKDIAKLAIGPSLFNIAEPVMFGLPVVMNPIFMIPTAIIPSINLSLAYMLTKIGILGKMVAISPWITPPVLQTWISTAGNIPATVFTILLLIMDILIYIPFVIASNKVNQSED